MSKRAYKIKKIHNEKNPTFNLSQEWDWIADLASWKAYNDDGECVMIEFPKEDVKEEIEAVKTLIVDNLGDLADNQNSLGILKAILKDCDNEDSVSYYCF